MGVCAGRVRNIDQTIKIDEKAIQDAVQHQQEQEPYTKENSKKANTDVGVNKLNAEDSDEMAQKQSQMSPSLQKSKIVSNGQPEVQNEFQTSINLDIQALKDEEQQLIQQDMLQSQGQDDATVSSKKNFNHSLSFSVKDNSINSTRQSIVQLQGVEEDDQHTSDEQKADEQANSHALQAHPLTNSQPFQHMDDTSDQLMTAVFMPVADKESSLQQNDNKFEQEPEHDSHERNSVQFIPQNESEAQKQDDNAEKNKNNVVLNQNDEEDSATPPVSLNIGPITVNTENKKQQQIIEQQQLDIDINQDYQEEPKQKRYKRKKARAVLQREYNANTEHNQQDTSVKSEDLEINIDTSIQNTIKETRTMELAKRMETKKQEQLDNLLSGNVLGLPQPNGKSQKAEDEKDNILGEILGADNFNI